MPSRLDSFTHNDYEIIKREVLHEGIFRMARYQIRYRLFNGQFSNTAVRELMERTSAAAVLPYDPLTDKVLLIEQFRIGALANPTSPWLLEIIAGVLKSDESPEKLAIREAQEEGGCKVLDLYYINEYFVSPGGCNEQLTLFCGRVDLAHAEGVFGLPEETEDINAFTLSADEAFIWLQEGKIKTSPAIIALQWLQLNREWLRELWRTK